MHLNFGINQEKEKKRKNHPLRLSQYLGEMQKLETSPLVAFEIWKVGLHIGTANPCFPQNIAVASLVIF